MKKLLTVTLLLLGAIMLNSVTNAQEQEIVLKSGFNHISSNLVLSEEYFDPEEDRGPNVILLLEQLRNENDDHNLILAIDESGRFFSPAFDFCNLPFWDTNFGLYVVVEEDDVLIWEGDLRDPQEELNITYRNYIAYLPDYPLNANADDYYVLSEIIDEVWFARDQQGGFMAPHFNFSNMNPWTPGNAYFLATNIEEAILTYPEERDEELVFFEHGNHWEMLRPSHQSECLLVNGIDGGENWEPENSDQIAAISERGHIVGVGTVHENQCGICIWADTGVEGFEEYLDAQETFELIYWDESIGQEFETEFTNSVYHPGNEYRRNSLNVVEIEVDVGPQLREQEIEFHEGWNIISLNVHPPERFWRNQDGPDIHLMTEGFEDDGGQHLIMLKDELGRFYIPEFDFCNIPYWDLQDGYLVHVDEDITLTWSGLPVPPDQEIEIHAGWNIIAYLPTYELSADAPDFPVISPILDDVIIAKDVNGNFMTPEFDFSNMPPWRETQGYQINLRRDVVFSYPAQPQEFNLANQNHTFEHITPLNTGQNMSLLIHLDCNNTAPVVRAMNANGLVVGSDRIDGNNHCGLAVWGDDQSTEDIEGLRAGEAFKLMLWNPQDGTEQDLHVKSILTGDGLTYEKDALTVIEAVTEAEMPTKFSLQSAYPNPFNSVTRLTYNVPTSSKSTLAIYNTNGQMVETLVNQDLEAGQHSVIWNPVNLSAGLYIAKLQSNSKEVSRKIVYMK